MKSTTIAELGLARNVILDLCEFDPGLHVQLKLFLSKTDNICRTRGWKNLLLLDFPALGGLVDIGLSSGFINFDKVPTSFGKLNTEQKVRSSWIYNSLLSLLFNMDGNLYQDLSAIHVYAVRQLLYMHKKLRIDCPQERVKDAVEAFAQIDRDLRPPSAGWENDHYSTRRYRFSDSDSSHLSNRCRNAIGLLDQISGRVVPNRSVDLDTIVPKHGPGAVADLKRGKDKYSFPHWPKKLGNTFPQSIFGSLSEEFFKDEEKICSDIEPPARLIAVPKSFKGPRLIASEPTAHQFLQQGLMRWIRQNLSYPLRASIDFLSQDPSKDRALEASRTGDLSTVDLSSASDRLSCWVVERVFGSNQSLLSALHAVRTRSVVDATGTDSMDCLQIKKFAAQGSAVTFPIQTIVYACCCYAAVCATDGIAPTKRNLARISRKVRVFGDDIILPSSSVPVLVELLEFLELKVNVTKSHYLGHFRESCGMDAFRGEDITPTYVSDLQLKPGAERLSSWVEVSNNFHLRGLWRTAAFMIDEIPSNQRGKLVVSNVGTPGIRLATFCVGTAVRQSRVRYSHTLHRREAKALCLRHTTKKASRGSSDDLLDFFLQDPDPQTKWAHGYITRDSTVLKVEWVPVS
jgi:hypothetical protein